MYLKYFGLDRAPFAITPDPGFVFLSSRHEDALAHLVYGVSRGGGGGFVQLTGEVGTGKTTLCRLLLEQTPEHTRVALILNPAMTPKELVASTLSELEVPFPVRATHKRLVDILNAYLLQAHSEGARVVLIIDEAQNLTPQALEQVRLLTNLETATEKLLQIVLIGQPELRDLLNRRDLRQLAQRVTARYHLEPLDEAETMSYVQHRMQVAGAHRNPFSDAAMRAIHRRSQGVPRLINIIAERSLLGAYSMDSEKVTPRLVQQAAREAMPSSRNWVPALLGGLAAALLIGSASALIWHQGKSKPEPVNSTELEVAGSGQMAAQVAAQSATESLAYGSPGSMSLNDLILPDQQTAGAELAGVWGEGTPNPGQCQPVPAPGWRCLRLRGNSTALRQIDRPVLLRVAAPDSGWLLLTELGSSHAVLRKGDLSQAFSWTEIETRWAGEFRLIFAVSSRAPVVLEPGDVHIYVPELRELLAVSGTSDRYDDALVSEVRKVQRQNGLSIDGTIGPETLFALTQKIPGPGPTLRRDPPELQGTR